MGARGKVATKNSKTKYCDEFEQKKDSPDRSLTSTGSSTTDVVTCIDHNFAPTALLVGNRQCPDHYIAPIWGISRPRRPHHPEQSPSNVQGIFAGRQVVCSSQKL